MSQEQGLLSAIAEVREDITARLVLADWYEDDDRLSRAAVLRAEVAAAQILGWKNTMSILDVEQHYGVIYTEEQLRCLAVFPFSEKVLRKCKNTHVLVPGYPFSLLSLNERLQEKEFLSKVTWTVVKEDSLGHQQVRCGSYLLRKKLLPNSTRKTYEQQQALLLNEEVPFACEMAFMIFLYERITKEILFRSTFVRCRDEDPISGFAWLGRLSKLWKDLHVTRTKVIVGFKFGLASSYKPDIVTS